MRASGVSTIRPLGGRPSRAGAVPKKVGDFFRGNGRGAVCSGVMLARFLSVPLVLVPVLLLSAAPAGAALFSRKPPAAPAFERDQNTCQYCGKVCDRKDLNLDHVIPRDRGGPTTWENIVCSCIPCNTRKANRTPSEAALHLIRKPKRPKWRPFVQINFTLYHHDSWKHFIDLAYWNVELGEDVR